METAQIANELSNSGYISLIPTFFVLAIAIWVRRPIEALVGGILVGCIIIYGTQTVTGFSDLAQRTMKNDDMIWVIIVCGGMGALIGLFIRTGSLYVFMDMVINKVKTRMGAIWATWFMGVILFVDDYLNSITVGTAMSRLTDKFKISREMLAYIVDSTAAPISVIIPISTWAVFFATILEDVKLAPEGGGLLAYISGIPYMIYPWIAVLMVPLVASGKVPLFGLMKKAEMRTIEHNQPIPPGSENINGVQQKINEKLGVKRSQWLFTLPMIALVAFTLYFDFEFLYATIATLGLTAIVIIVSGVLESHDTFDTMLEGFKTMVDPLIIIICAYMLKDVNDQLGLASYVLEGTVPYLTSGNLPIIIFAVMGFIAFATGSSWGMFVIALPIIAELAFATNANIPLVIGATLSASTFGAHACLYADATVLTAQSCGTTSVQHMATQLPYALLAAGLSLVIFGVIA